MKSLSGILFIAGIIALTSCGPSAQQRAAEQARLDSIAAVAEQARLDSIQQATADSIAKAQAAAAAAATRRAAPAPAPKPATDPNAITRERRSEAEVQGDTITRQRRSETIEAQELNEDGTITRRRRSEAQ